METDRATDILRSLADGRDPATGEQFPSNSPYQQAETVRALFMAVDALDNVARRGRRQAARSERATGTNLPGQDMSRRNNVEAEGRMRRPIDPNRPKLGTAWTAEEEAQLREEFAARKPIPEIAAAHGRNAGGITARLIKLGLIEDNATNRAGHGNRPAGLPPNPIRPISPNRPTPSPPRELTQAEKDDFPF